MTNAQFTALIVVVSLIALLLLVLAWPVIGPFLGTAPGLFVLMLVLLVIAALVMDHLGDLRAKRTH